MSTKAIIQHSLGMSNRVLDKYLADLDPQAFLIRPVAGMNHIAWQVGHLISVERRLVEGAKPGSSPALPDGFDAQHAMDKHGNDGPNDFRTKDEYLSLWQAQRAATTAALEAMSDAELDAPCPDEKTRAMCPTIGTMFNLAGTHALLHLGQFVAVRRSQALPIAF